MVVNRVSVPWAAARSRPLLLLPQVVSKRSLSTLLFGVRRWTKVDAFAMDRGRATRGRQASWRLSVRHAIIIAMRDIDRETGMAVTWQPPGRRRHLCSTHAAPEQLAAMTPSPKLDTRPGRRRTEGPALSRIIREVRVC